jgi:hypothetical protein
MKQQNGTLLEGTFLDGALHGKGKETLEDGSVFEGAYDNGKKNGYGIFTWSNGC